MAKTAKKKTGTSLVKWEEELAEYAKESSQGAKVSEGKFISLKGGRMKFAGADVPDNELRCVVIGWMHHNVYYDPDEKYDPENPASPICWAFSKTAPEDGDMEALDSVPEKQCDNCAECPFNQWESGRGKGKACKNTVRLALIAEDDLGDLEEAEVVFLSVPVTSVKNWLKHIVDLRDKHKRPHWFTITEIKCVPDNSSQFKLTFDKKDDIEDGELYPPLKELWQSTMETIDFPYVAREKTEKPARGTTKKTNKFSKGKK